MLCNKGFVAALEWSKISYERRRLPATIGVPINGFGCRCSVERNCSLRRTDHETGVLIASATAIVGVALRVCPLDVDCDLS